MEAMDPTVGFDMAVPGKGSRRRRHAIHAQLRAAVLDGRLKAGVRVPASRALAKALGVARITVIAAYDMLVAEGYFVARHGAGTFVADAAATRAPARTHPSRAEPHPAFSPLARPDIRPVYASTHPRPAFDFTVGVPDVSQLRFDIWNRYAARAMRQYCRQGESYGDVRGSRNLRTAIAAHVSFSRAVAASDDTVIVTSGAQQAIALLAQVFVDPGRTTVAVEDPGYPPAFEAFAAAGAKVVSVPVDPQGIVVKRIPPDAKVVYVTPSHQFPLGVVTSRQRRAELLETAAAQGAVVVEDDYDAEFRFCGRPLDALQTMDRHQRVFYVGTFSKSLFPGARLGFVVAPPWAVDALIAAKHRADWHTNLMAQETLASFIAEGDLARHIRRMNKVYAARRNLLLSTLQRDFDSWLRPIPSEAGLHLSAMTAPGLSAPALVEAARALDVGIFAVRSNTQAGPAASCVLFGFGRIDEGDMGKALARLHRLLSSGDLKNRGALRQRS
jgi:GntR family transcriptional regulator/MocR family aminotransferase